MVRQRDSKARALGGRDEEGVARAGAALGLGLGLGLAGPPQIRIDFAFVFSLACLVVRDIPLRCR